MMSETSARARRFARWLGSLERNGFSGRRDAASPTAADAPAGVIGGRGVWAAGAGEVGPGAVGVGAARAVGAGGGASGGVGARGVCVAAGVGEVAAGEGATGGADGRGPEPGTKG